MVGFEQSIFIWEWSVLIYALINTPYTTRPHFVEEERNDRRGTVEKGEGMN